MATEKQHSSQKRPPNFSIEIPGGEIKKNINLEKLLLVRSFLTSTLNKQVKNSIIIGELLNSWIKEQLGGHTPREDRPFPSTSSKVTRKDVDQRLQILMGNIHLHGNQ